MGFVIPDEPKPPADDGMISFSTLHLEYYLAYTNHYSLTLFVECCMSGCAICVYDLYNEALEDYTKAIESLRTSLRTLGISEDKWPPKVRTSQGETKRVEVKKDSALSAFEEFERQLKMRKEAEDKKTVESSPGQ